MSTAVSSDFSSDRSPSRAVWAGVFISALEAWPRDRACKITKMLMNFKPAITRLASAFRSAAEGYEYGDPVTGQVTGQWQVKLLKEVKALLNRQSKFDPA